MSKDNKIAFHGSSADYRTMQKLGGILPRVGWQKPVLAKRIAKMPQNVQNLIYGYVGPELRGEPFVQKGGVADADPEVSVSLTWNPKVACFFPPAHIHIYLYVVKVEGLTYRDVDKFALTCGVNRSYMREIAVSNVPLTNIMGYCIVTRRSPPRDIQSVVTHQMEVLVGPYFPQNSQDQTGYTELTSATEGKFRIAKSIAGTFHTTDSLELQKKKDPLKNNPYI